MALFKRKPRLPEPPAPSGADQWLGDSQVGHTVRELMYLEALKAAGVDLEAPRTISFAFAATTESAASETVAALEGLPFEVTMTQPGGGALRVISATSASLALVPGIATWAQRMHGIGIREDVLYDGWIAFFDDVAPGEHAQFIVAH